MGRHSKTSELVWDLKASAGLLQGVSKIQKFGRRDACVATGVGSDIWTGEAEIYPFPTVAGPVRVRAGGDAADDADGGAGALGVELIGLDDTWTPATEVIPTAGAAAGAFSNTSFIRLFRARAFGAGAYGGTNVGDVHIETAGGVELAHMDAGRGQTLMAIYSIPAGKTGFLRKIVAVVGGTAQEVDLTLYHRDAADVTEAPFGAVHSMQVFAELVSGPGLAREYFSLPVFEEKTDVWFRAKASAGTAGVDVSFDITLLDN